MIMNTLNYQPYHCTDHDAQERPLHTTQCQSSSEMTLQFRVSSFLHSVRNINFERLVIIEL